MYRAVRCMHRDGFSLASICAALSISRSAFYSFERASHGKRAKEDLHLGGRIADIFRTHRRRYGARRISRQLRREGETCSRRRARKLLQKQGLQAIQPKSFRVKTTDSSHGLGYNDNLLLQALDPTGINQVWLGDITYIPLRGRRFAFLSALMDLYSRRILIWNLKDNMKEELVLSCLRAAIVSRAPSPGLIHHSDRGGQYAGGRYRRLLDQWRMVQSMSRADNCYDNAFMESCYGTLKRELEMEIYADLHEARKEIAAYVRYYNNLRLHSSLNYRTPAEFEASIRSAK